MSLPKQSVEERMKALEQEVAHLRLMVSLQQPAKQEGWKKIVGAFAGDPAFLEAMRLGRQWRESFDPKSC